MLRVRPSIEQVIIKTNEGVSGAGNAMVDLTGVADLPEPDRRSAIDTRVRAMQLESSTVALDLYVAKFERGGGIVEERIVGKELLSPSVQLRAATGRQRRAAVDPRSAARRRERPELSRLLVPGRPGLLPADQ